MPIRDAWWRLHQRVAAHAWEFRLGLLREFERWLRPKPSVPMVGELTPDKDVIYKAWVVMADGRVGYIDHYKTDGRFGVRPVSYDTGRFYLNPSEHWTIEQRVRIPEELTLSVREFRGAELVEIPMMYRRAQ